MRESQRDTAPPITLSIDIGGTGIKALAIQGLSDAFGQRQRVKTPRPATPGKVVNTIVALAETMRPFHQVAVGFPGVVVSGVARTAPNLDGIWKDVPVREILSRRLGVPVIVVNDADLHGFGAISGKGPELLITLGTGVGSCLFIDGRLFPNVELGHHPFEDSETYEQRLGEAALKQIGKVRWNRRLRRAIRQLRHTFNFEHMYIGGGNARVITLRLPDDITIVQNSIAFFGGPKLWNLHARRRGTATRGSKA